MTDRELLLQYVSEGSEDAFAELVARHTNMVYGVSLRVIGRCDLAEDVTQAVFLVLARKAPRLSRKTVLPGWLFKTAEYAARNALKMQARAKEHERKAAQMRAKIKSEASSKELRSHLDAMLASLPRTERDVVVMRYLEGHSEADAARELECPRGTVSSLLARALKKLKGRFRRKGMAIPAGAIVSVLGAQAAEAAPSSLAASIGAACIGKAAGSSGAAAIAEGVMKAMMWAKVKLAAVTAVVVVTACVTTPLALHMTREKAAQDAAPPATRPDVRPADVAVEKPEALTEAKAEPTPPAPTDGNFAPTKLWDFPSQEARSSGKGMIIGKTIVLEDSIVLLGQVMSHVAGEAPKHGNYLIRLDVLTGKETRRRKLKDHLVQNLVEAEGRLFLTYGRWVKRTTGTGWTGKVDGIRCFDAKELRELWSHKPGGDQFTSDVSATRVVLREGESVSALDSATGEKVWSVRPEGRPYNFPLIHGERIYLIRFSGDLICLDARTGNRLWATTLFPPVGENVHAPSVLLRRAGDLVIVSVESKLRALDAVTGEERWRRSFGGRIGGPAAITTAITTDRGFFSAPGEIRALDLRTGNELWRAEIETGDYCQLVASGERLFAAGKKMFHGFDAATGKTLWRRRTWARSWEAPIVHGKRLYLCTSDSKLTCVLVQGKPAPTRAGFGREQNTREHIPL